MYVVPCRALNPKDPNTQVKLLSSSTGLELPNVIELGSHIGFKIQNAQLPDHSGEIKCLATRGNQTESVQFTLKMILDPFGLSCRSPTEPNHPNADCTISKPTIGKVEDVHEGESVTLNCSLIVKKICENDIKLKWNSLGLNFNGRSNDNIELFKDQKPYDPGTIELIVRNKIQNVTSKGKFR